MRLDLLHTFDDLSFLASAFCPEGSPDQPTIHAELGQNEFHLMNWNYTDALVHGSQNGCEQQIACPTHTAAKDYSLRADNTQYVSDCDPQVSPDSLKDLLRDEVAFQRSPYNDSCINLVQVMVYEFADPRGMAVQHLLHTHGGDGWAGGVEFQAALSATTTRESIHFHNVMAEFACCSANPQMKLPIDHHPAPNASPDRQAD
jgi:hypothetical protein